MRNSIRAISLPVIVLFSVFIGLSPFRPEPHLVEKLRMLFSAELTRPIDIFDLVFHAAPILLMVYRIYIHFSDRKKGVQSTPPS